VQQVLTVIDTGGDDHDSCGVHTTRDFGDDGQAVAEYLTTLPNLLTVKVMIDPDNPVLVAVTEAMTTARCAWPHVDSIVARCQPNAV
jgi:hypothetical protein